MATFVAFLGGTSPAEASDVSLPEVNLATPVISQKSKQITGTVIDDTGLPVIGANILVKGTTHGCITDADGNFTLEEVPEGAVIQVSYIGFLPQEIASGKQTLFNIVLKEDNQALDEVVVVGYGAVRKADLAGSVSVMDSKSFKETGRGGCGRLWHAEESEPDRFRFHCKVRSGVGKQADYRPVSGFVR